MIDIYTFILILRVKLMYKMMDKIDKDKGKKRKNDTDFLEEVRKAFGGKPYIRKKELLTVLEKDHQNIVGYDPVTIESKINKIVDGGTLVKISGDELEKYGIIENDGRATYLFFKETTEIKEHIDEVLKLLNSDKIKNIELVLRELDSYRNRYFLDGRQLDKFVEKLWTKDDKLRYSIFMLLFGEINKDVEPTDIAQLKDVLKSLLKEYD